MYDCIKAEVSKSPNPSSWNVHPSKDPNGKYKFASFDIELNLSVKVTTRSNYDFLSWLGDCGGFKDGIFAIGSIIMSAF